MLIPIVILHIGKKYQPFVSIQILYNFFTIFVIIICKMYFHKYKQSFILYYVEFFKVDF